jgi:hypothetical protein
VDEPGKYTNATTGTDKYDGRKNTGGEANNRCQIKGAGWYLPSIGELEAIYKVSSFRSMFWKGSAYWSSTHYDGEVYGKKTDDYSYLYVFSGAPSNNWTRPGMTGNKKIQQHSVRCFWKPDTSQVK